LEIAHKVNAMELKKVCFEFIENRKMKIDNIDSDLQSEYQLEMERRKNNPKVSMTKERPFQLSPYKLLKNNTVNNTVNNNIQARVQMKEIWAWLLGALMGFLACAMYYRKSKI